MEITLYKVVLFVENDICSWIVQACKPPATDYYTHCMSNKTFTSLEYVSAIEDASRYIFDRRYKVPVYHHGVKNPIDFLFTNGKGI